MGPLSQICKGLLSQRLDLRVVNPPAIRLSVGPETEAQNDAWPHPGWGLTGLVLPRTLIVGLAV